MKENFFRRNQKKFLAIFASVLMVAFILPLGANQFGRARDTVAGRLNGKKVYSSQLLQASREWMLLKRIPDPQSRFGAPLVSRLGTYDIALGMRFGSLQGFPRSEVAAEIDPRLRDDMSGRRDSGAPEHPELFLMLQEEARQAGIRVSDEQVQEVYEAAQFSIGAIASGETADDVRDAIRHLLEVQGLIQRYAAAIKVSEPEVTRNVALQGQTPVLKMVEFSADAFKQDVPPPTTQQAAEQFQKYAAQPTSQPSDANPFGFGYEYPDRVKLAYIEVPRAQVVEAVRQTKSPFDWEVQALRYYREHLQEFVSTTQPSTTQSSTQPATTQSATTEPTTTASTAPSTTQASATTSPSTQQARAVPTTQPFEQVKDQAVRKAMDGDVDAMSKQVVAAVRDRLIADWEAFRRNSSANPTTAPTTQPGGYGSFEYLRRVAEDVQARFKGVRPSVAWLDNDWKTADDLAKLPGIGQTSAFDLSLPFAAYAMRAEAFVPPAQKDDPNVLSLFEPSQAMKDLQGNTYFFMLTGAEKAHPPTTMADVAQRVESDYRTAAAFERAKAAAQKLLDAAKKSGNLADAAKAENKPVITENFALTMLIGQGRDLVPDYPLSDETAREQMGVQARQLVAQATPQNKNPVSLITLPTAGKVFVAQLADLNAHWTAAEYAQIRTISAEQARSNAAHQLLSQYFSRTAVEARMNYQEEADTRAAKSKDKTGGSAKT